MKLRLAGVGSVFVAWSVARTSKVWGPAGRSLAGVWVLPGPVQGPKAAESKRHWKLEPASEEEKPKVGVAPESSATVFWSLTAVGSSSAQSTRTATVASEPPLRV